jgi:hypothetical protein
MKGDQLTKCKQSVTMRSAGAHFYSNLNGVADMDERFIGAELVRLNERVEELVCQIKSIAETLKGRQLSIADDDLEEESSDSTESSMADGFEKSAIRRIESSPLFPR